MATIRKLRGKWQAIVRTRGIQTSRVFTKKQLASDWANKVEAEIINGTYQDNNELIKISVKHLMELYYDHAKNTTEHAKRLKDECNVHKLITLFDEKSYLFHFALKVKLSSLYSFTQSLNILS